MITLVDDDGNFMFDFYDKVSFRKMLKEAYSGRNKDSDERGRSNEVVDRDGKKAVRPAGDDSCGSSTDDSDS